MLTTLVLAAALSAGPAHAQAPDTLDLFAPVPVAGPAPLTAAARLRPASGPLPLLAAMAPAPASGMAGVEEPQVVEYSDGYFTRLTIHKWASYLTVPLFVGQYIVGRKLINGEGSDNLRNVHGALAAGIGGLFVVNTITGGLNALEARKDPVERNRRTLHSVLMLLADAGFVATGMLAKENEDEGGFSSGPADNTTHRNVAIASMATALVSYVIMLPPFRNDG